MNIFAEKENVISKKYIYFSEFTNSIMEKNELVHLFFLGDVFLSFFGIIIKECNENINFV